MFAVRYVKNAIESDEGCLHKAFWNVVKYYDKYYVKCLSKKKNTIQQAYYILTASVFNEFISLYTILYT